MLDVFGKIISFISFIKNRFMFKFFVTEADRIKSVSEVMDIIEKGELYSSFKENDRFFAKISHLKSRVGSKRVLDLIESLEEERSRKGVKFVDNKFTISELGDALISERE